MSTVPASAPLRHAQLALIALALIAAFVWLAGFAPRRVGDGSEYYGLYLAWEHSLRPWMTEAAYSAYSALYSRHEIIDLVTRDYLASAFPALRVGDTADFNHFWLYSMLARAMGWSLETVGLPVRIHTAFVALHGLMLFATIALAHRYYGLRGVAVIAFMTCASPMLWFANKVHTEFFTYCLTLSAVICVLVGRRVSAAVLLGLCATQNPSFAIVAAALVADRLRDFRQRPSAAELAGIAAAGLLSVMHPLYYLYRVHVVTPQLLAGGAALGTNLWISHIWFIDPDVGLLPHWPLGTMAIVLGIWASARRPRGEEGLPRYGLSWWLFCAVYLASCLYADASTINLNSGATPGPARYAIWYMALAFPLVLEAAGWLRVNYRRMAIAGVIILAVQPYNWRVNKPQRPESFSGPTGLSSLIQTHLPGLYDPPGEIFVERYSGFGEAAEGKLLQGVLGPDCRKLLVIPNANRGGGAAPQACGIDPQLLDAYVRERALQQPAEHYERIDDETYARLTAKHREP